jgi:hypothetical protein
MNMHPVMLLMLANQRQRELADEAERHRILSAARKARASRRAGWGRKAPAVRGQPTGNVAPCDPSAAVPAR